MPTAVKGCRNITSPNSGGTYHYDRYCEKCHTNNGTQSASRGSTHYDSFVCKSCGERQEVVIRG